MKGGIAVFAAKELREILRTWRIWVLPGIVLFFALTGPVIARFTPEIVGALAADQLGQFTIPTPTYVDAYTQWVKNLSQIVLFALVIIYAGIVSGELKSGTAVLVLTKPVSRTAFVIAKAAVHSAFLAILVVVGTLVTWGMTAATFGTAPGPALWAAALTWLLFGVLFIALMTLLSVLVNAAAGAAGAGLAPAGAVGHLHVGDLRRVHMVTCDMDTPDPSFIPTSGGIFRDCLIHDFDILRWLTGQRIETVYAPVSYTHLTLPTNREV